jgi:hypothetical protein
MMSMNNNGALMAATSLSYTANLNEDAECCRDHANTACSTNHEAQELLGLRLASHGVETVQLNHGHFNAYQNSIHETILPTDAFQTLRGCGLIEYSNGDIYEGSFLDNDFHGEGIMKFHASGDIYKGQWKGNKFCGEGVYTFATGDVYTGDFCNGEFNGHGVLQFANGNQYKGELVNDLAHGAGVLTFYDVAREEWTVLNGYFYKSKFVTSDRILYDHVVRNESKNDNSDDTTNSVESSASMSVSHTQTDEENEMALTGASAATSSSLYNSEMGACDNPNTLETTSLPLSPMSLNHFACVTSPLTIMQQQACMPPVPSTGYRNDGGNVVLAEFAL